MQEYKQRYGNLAPDAHAALAYDAALLLVDALKRAGSTEGPKLRDALAQTILGYETTLPVTMEEMLHHTKAVARGAKNALIVGYMPFLSYQVSTEEGVTNAGRFLKEAGAHAVKIEGWMPEAMKYYKPGS